MPRQIALADSRSPRRRPPDRSPFVYPHDLRHHYPRLMPRCRIRDDYSQGSKLIRAEIPIFRLNAVGEVQDTVWVGPGHEEFMSVLGEERGGNIPLFQKKPAYATGDSLIVIGTSDSMAFRLYDALGRLRRIVRVPGYDLSLPDSVVEAEKRALLGPEPSPSWRRRVEMFPTPASRPAYHDLIVDAEGYVWAGEFRSAHSGGTPRAWEIFSPTGRWMGSLSTPARFEVFEIGADYILGSRRDDFDLEHVELLHLNRVGH